MMLNAPSGSNGAGKSLSHTRTAPGIEREAIPVQCPYPTSQTRGSSLVQHTTSLSWMIAPPHQHSGIICVSTGDRMARDTIMTLCQYRTSHSRLVGRYTWSESLSLLPALARPGSSIRQISTGHLMVDAQPGRVADHEV
eukprot:1117927-Rhodomonas_salina.5